MDLEEEAGSERGEDHEEAGDEPRVGGGRVEETHGLEEVTHPENQPYPRADEQRPKRQPGKEWREREARERETQGEKARSEEHTSELQSRQYLVCRLLLEKKKTPTETVLRT